MIKFFKRKIVMAARRFLELVVDYDGINRIIQSNLATMVLHQETFKKFRRINEGREVVVFATGPSSKLYKPIPGCVHIGVNHAFLREDIKFDYLFTYDIVSIANVIEQMNNYRRGECVKFYGLRNDYEKLKLDELIPESEAIKANALRYRVDIFIPKMYGCEFAYDLSTQPIGSFGSVVFAALQFALWTHPKRIYLVGCDCSNAHGKHFFPESLVLGSTTDEGLTSMARNHEKFKVFAQRYYPDVEIVSVNPVALRGLYRDIDQVG